MTVSPAAASAATQAVRPIASGASRLLFHAAIGASATLGIAFWADEHYKDARPDANGDSFGYIDRKESRELFSGFDGFPAIVTFTALLAASFLYTRGRQHLEPKEFSMLRASYEILGGGLVGTVLAPGLLRKLPAEYDPKSGTAPQLLAPAPSTVEGAARLTPQEQG